MSEDSPPRQTVGEPYPPVASPVAPIAANATTTVEPTTQELEEQHASFVEERQLVQGFAQRVIECFDEQCIAVVLLPWMGDGGTPPAGVLCPPSNTALLNEAQLRAAVQGKSVIVCPCTFKFPSEENAAARIIEQLLNLHDMCILAAHLLTPEIENSREWSQYVNEKMRQITETHVDDVLFDPDPEPTQLRLRIKMAKHSWETNRQHLQQIMQQEPQAPTMEEIQALEAQHRQLLWEDIPRELMPHFGVMDPHLHETDNEVGDFTLVSKMVCNCGAVWEARNKHGEKVAIKCIEKKLIHTPGEVEGINREYRFLQSFLRHPNIVRALDFLHSQTYVYLILEHVGNENLVQHISKLPGKHMDANTSLGIFKQVVSALTYCHEKEITHRGVALNHVVLSKSETDDRLIPHLVDFHNAMVAKSGVQSRSVCGTFPCIAPEVLSSESYIPIFADVWSIGILLLEIVGGLGTLAQVFDLTPEEAEEKCTREWTEEQQQAMSAKIKNYFLADGSHQLVLAHMNGVQNEEVLGHLQSLLVLPAARPRLATLFPSTREASETNATEHANDVVVTDVDVGDVPA